MLQDVCWSLEQMVDSRENGRIIWEKRSTSTQLGITQSILRVFKFMNAKPSSIILMTNPFLPHAFLLGAHWFMDVQLRVSS